MVGSVEDRRSQRGQVLVLFTLAMVGIIGIVGLVLDGGSAFAQRRSEQNVADLAAMAAANAYLNTTGTAATKKAAAELAAQQIAAANGYTNDPANGMHVDITVSGGDHTGTASVNVGKRHPNKFAGLLGMPTWDIGVTAASVSIEQPNGANGVLPLIFNQGIFDAPADAVCYVDTESPCGEVTFELPGTGNEDVPQDATQFNFTVFCAASGKDFDGDGAGDNCNANSDDIKDYIRDDGTSTEVWVDEDIGPLNAGTHADIFQVLEDYALGDSFPVPIVDSEGNITAFAYFHLVAIEGSPDRVIKGYFEAPYLGDKLEVSSSHAGAGLDTDNHAIKLTN